MRIYTEYTEYVRATHTENIDGELIFSSGIFSKEKLSSANYMTVFFEKQYGSLCFSEEALVYWTKNINFVPS